MNKRRIQHSISACKTAIFTLVFFFNQLDGNCREHHVLSKFTERPKSSSLLINALVLQIGDDHRTGSKFTSYKSEITILIILIIIYLCIANIKNKKLLRSKQDKINEQNIQIQQGIEKTNKQNDRLNTLLEEKEWLVKEVHHRVRNNLQIISSLLNTQSSYLENEEALKAIRDSQNRLQAIAIVHQKLYQSNELSSISLQVYIKELAQKILSSYHEHARIKFRIELEPARLNTDQIVPLGLIINEIITNSVKHAFADDWAGIITLYSSVSTDHFYEIVITDNGRGLPVNFDANNCHSLGMNLIIGLTRQLGGRFSIKSINGTRVKIAIPLNRDTAAS